MSATQESSELLELTLVDAAAAVARREVSSVELVDACLARIGALDDRLRAFIAVHGGSARQVAKAAETMIAAGHRLGPLHGVPIALKDNIAVARLADHGRQQGAAPTGSRTRTRPSRRGCRQAGRDRHRQDQPARVRLGRDLRQPALRHRAQPVGPGALPGRVQRRLGRGRRRAHLLRRDRHRHRRLDPAAVGDQWHRRHPARRSAG